MKFTLCGSSRFEAHYHAWKKALELAGHIVFTLEEFPSQHSGIKDWYSEEQKVILDSIHLQKISKSDAIFVLNVFAYIGESTLNEIKVAKAIGKKVYFLESWGKGYGIDRGHFDNVRAACKKYTGSASTESQIDTCYPYELCIYSDDTLGDAGETRRKIIEMTSDKVLLGYSND